MQFNLKAHLRKGPLKLTHVVVGWIQFECCGSDGLSSSLTIDWSHSEFLDRVAYNKAACLIRMSKEEEAGRGVVVEFYSFVT